MTVASPLAASLASLASLICRTGRSAGDRRTVRGLRRIETATIGQPSIGSPPCAPKLSSAARWPALLPPSAISSRLRGGRAMLIGLHGGPASPLPMNWKSWLRVDTLARSQTPSSPMAAFFLPHQTVTVGTIWSALGRQIWS